MEPLCFTTWMVSPQNQQKKERSPRLLLLRSRRISSSKFKILSRSHNDSLHPGKLKTLRKLAYSLEAQISLTLMEMLQRNTSLIS
jgi:hypothetical protein